MAIYTSYFGNYRNFPENALIINVSRYPPKDSNAVSWIAVAPSAELLKLYKAGIYSEEDYVRIYNVQLSYLNKKQIIQALEEHNQEYGNVILCCYEKKGKFCHRHLLADWLNIGIEEL